MGAAGDAAGRWREYHRQSGMAEIPRYSLSDRPGGGGEDHLYSVAGQAAGMAAGRKARLKILSFCLFGGGTHIGSDGLVRGDLRRYSGLPGMAFLLFLVAGYLSPNRWLMLISLSDVSVLALVIMICKRCICKRKGNEQDT